MTGRCLYCGAPYSNGKCKDNCSGPKTISLGYCKCGCELIDDFYCRACDKNKIPVSANEADTQKEVAR